MLAADTDWETQGFNVADRALGRRVMQAWADGKPDGVAGRRLRGWLHAAGLVPEERCVLVLDATEWGGDTFIAHTWPATRRGLERAGRISAEELARFDARARAVGGRAGRSTGASSATPGAAASRDAASSTARRATTATPARAPAGAG